jgi:hypothetical protein
VLANTASNLHIFERRKNMNKGDLVNEVSKVVKTKTGEEIHIAASKVPKFVAGKALKEVVK